MNQFFKYGDREEPKKFGAELDSAELADQQEQLRKFSPPLEVEEPTPEPLALTDKQAARVKRYWSKEGMSVEDQAENVCNFDFCKEYICNYLGFELETF